MTDHQNPNPTAPSSSSNSKVPTETNHNGSSGISTAAHKLHYPNHPDPMNPDAATLREQWRYATRQYSRWYSQAWGSAILAGLAFFALGWIIKGSNPLPSSGNGEDETKKRLQPPQQHQQEGHYVPCPPVPHTLTSNPRDAVEAHKSRTPNTWDGTKVYGTTTFPKQ